jgi:predicted phosphoribosyltransferase
MKHPTIVDIPELRDRRGVFEDRRDAGRVLAGMLEGYAGSGALVLAIPSGGVPVALEIARHLGLDLDVAVVSKILYPWTTEAGFGAVAFDGTVWVNPRLTVGMTEAMMESQAKEALAKVRRRMRRLRGDRPLPRLQGRAAILVDDGLASGSTMRVAVSAVRRLEPAEVIVAVPTGHARTVMELAREVDALYCANIRGGAGFAVAEAYRNWYDEDEEEVARLIEAWRARDPR